MPNIIGASNFRFKLGDATHFPTPSPSCQIRSSHQNLLFQSGQCGATFLCFMTNHPEKTNFSYERYVTNQLRHYFGFEGTP
ncbi:MAG: hypothetical protein Ct9H90mP8_1150 [Pseudomonadota bacterium]|nr:MAG: hypothetical protein Ct9H90mP8_1150 [Pseudomonadota bacterium]